MTDLSMRHLDEEERQGLADDTLGEPRRAAAAAHVAGCPECKEDVGRLREVVTQARAQEGTLEMQPDDQAMTDAWWPDIRARIESTKVVTLGGSSTERVARRRQWAIGLGLSAAVLVAAVLVRRSMSEGTRSAPETAVIMTADDSTTAYQREVRILLEDLELRRAMLRPDVAASVDRDLNAIDRAIAELREALKHDPNNPALRQLLAASYRQKRDLLKRVGNAS
jgi:anti-sigma factor RsiW